MGNKPLWTGKGVSIVSFKRRMQRQQIGYTPTERERKMLSALQGASHVLREYAKGSNWALMDGKSIWLGEGSGPDLAEMVLGVKRSEKAVQGWHKEGESVQEDGPKAGENP